MAIETYVVLKASIEEFEAKMGAARATMEATAKHGGSTFESMSAGTKVALGAVVVATAAVGVKAVEMASQFQASMERLSTQAGVPQSQIAGLSQSVLHLAGQVGFAPNNLAEALFHVESSFASTGITGAQAMEILKTGAQGAAIGGANLVDVQNALDAAIASGIPGVENFGQAMGALNAIVGAGDMTMQNLAEALGSGVLAVVKNYGLTLTDVGAALATFGDNNIRGAQAATYLRMAVQSIAVPMKAGQQVLAEIGMTSNQMAQDMQHGGIITALQDLKSHFEAAGITGTNVGAELTTIFGKRAGSGIAVLYDQLDRLQSKYGEIQKGASQFDEDWKKTQATFAQQWKEVVASVDAFLIQMGSKLLPIVSSVMSSIGDLVGWLGKHNDLLRTAASLISGVLVPALIVWGAHQAAVISAQVLSSIGMMIVQVGNLAREMTAMGVASDIATGPLGMIAAAVVVLTGAFGQLTNVTKSNNQVVQGFLDALPTGSDKLAALTAETNKWAAATGVAALDAHGGKVVVDGLSLSYEAGVQQFKAFGDAQDKMTAQQKNAAAGAAEANKVQAALNVTTGAAGPILHGLTQAEADAAQEAKADKSAVDDLKNALDALLGVHLNAEKAIIQYNQSIDALTKGIVKDKDATNDNTAVGQANLTLVIDSIEKAKAQADAYAKETGNVGAANKMLFDHIQQLLGVAEKSGLTKGQVDQLRNMFDLQSVAIGITNQAVKDLTTQYGKVPTQIATTFVATLNLDPSAAAAAVGALAAKVAAFQNQLRIVSQGLTPTHGAFAAGGITNGPVFLAGEGNPAYPEYVIPTDPSYAANAVDLWKKLGKDLHLYAAGGIVGIQAAAAGGGAGGEMAIRQALIRQSLNDATTSALNSVNAVPAFFAAQQAQFGLGYPVNIPGGLAGWIAAAEAIAGVSSLWTSALAQLIMFESGGNPNAINLTDCISIDAMILTRRGWLKHDEVRVGDDTIGFNAATKHSEWTRITRVVHYQDAQRVRLGNERWHATVTPNHRWVSAPRETIPKAAFEVCPECGWLPGSHRHRKTAVTQPANSVAVHRRKIHGIVPPPQAMAFGPPRFVETQHLKTNDRLILAAPADTGPGLPVSDGEAELLGWLAGDGNIETDTARKNPAMSIAQSKPAMLAKLQALLIANDFAVVMPDGHRTGARRNINRPVREVSEYIDSRSTRFGNDPCGPRHVFRFTPTYRTDLLSRAGHPKADAVDIVLAMSASQRSAWLSGFIDAEGSRDGEHISVSQTYGPILEAAHLAGYLCGYRPRLTDNKVTNPHWSPSATVSLNRPVVVGQFLRLQDAGLGDVWCVTTELGSWTVEQDGQIFLTGNSNAAAGHPSQGLMQTIPSTFAAYALPGYGNIRNPVDNIIAGIRYIEARYGDIWHTPGMLSVARGGPYVGYDAGGVLPPGLTMAYNGTGRDEFVSRSPGGGGDVHIHIHAGTVVGAGGAQQLANMIRDEMAKGDRYRTPWAH